jgi:hypothetical protein
MVDESSLASTRQMQTFMEKIGPQDWVLLVGDTRQHQGVDAGKPFEQMQQAGMQTSQLDQIMRQKDPELLRVVEHFAKNETAIGVSLLQQQSRITEIPDNAQRIEAMSKNYAAKPENTLVVSPDNASRREINDAIRTELKDSGIISTDDHRMDVLTQRSELTSTIRLAAGCTSTLKLSFTTAKSNQLRERPPLNTRDISLLTQWATTYICNLTIAAATTTKELVLGGSCLSTVTTTGCGFASARWNARVYSESEG